MAVTFRLQAHDIATRDRLVLEDGRYHLQIEGPGAPAFTIDADRGPDDSDALSPIRLRLVVR